MTQHRCKVCGRPVTSDEIALTMKLQGKQSRSYFCLDCQAAYSNTTRARLEELLALYHRTGLYSLFARQSAGPAYTTRNEE